MKGDVPRLGAGGGGSQVTISPSPRLVGRPPARAQAVAPRGAAGSAARRLLCALLVLASASLPPHAAAVHLRGRHANVTNVTTSEAGGADNYRAPKIYFLFMAVDKISNLAIWKAFLSAAPGEQYGAYVHCKWQSCMQAMAGAWPFQLVPSVHSEYCTDLVSPMNQLMKAALLEDQTGFANDLDKFVFVSDSTLPAKPFSHVYNTLSNRQGSAFCVFPASGWAEVPVNGGFASNVAMKHHQWIILERAQAKQADVLWGQGVKHNLMAEFQLNAGLTNKSYIAGAPGYNRGCLDEFWHLAAVYGTQQCSGYMQCSAPEFYRFLGAPLQLSANVGWQGQCDTFVLWPQYLHVLGDNNAFDALHASLDQDSVPHPGDQARPGWWDAISTHGIRTLRESPFLFARKFVDNPRLTDKPHFAEAYISIALGG